jgi:hypothetical protein
VTLACFAPYAVQKRGWKGWESPMTVGLGAAGEIWEKNDRDWTWRGRMMSGKGQMTVDILLTVRGERSREKEMARLNVITQQTVECAAATT